jgi:hypothetical protein
MPEGVILLTFARQHSIVKNSVQMASPFIHDPTKGIFVILMSGR